MPVMSKFVIVLQMKPINFFFLRNKEAGMFRKTKIVGPRKVLNALA